MSDFQKDERLLFEQIALGPGWNPVVLRKAKGLARDIAGSSSDPYVGEKLHEVVEDLEVWFSERRWRKDDDGQGAKLLLHQSVEKLALAVSSLAERK